MCIETTMLWLIILQKMNQILQVILISSISSGESNSNGSCGIQISALRTYNIELEGIFGLQFLVIITYFNLSSLDNAYASHELFVIPCHIPSQTVLQDLKDLIRLGRPTFHWDDPPNLFPHQKRKKWTLLYNLVLCQEIVNKVVIFCTNSSSNWLSYKLFRNKIQLTMFIKPHVISFHENHSQCTTDPYKNLNTPYALGHLQLILEISFNLFRLCSGFFLFL